MAPPRNARPAMHEAQHGEFNIRWRRADLVAQLHIAPSVVSRQLRRLRVLGLIKKVTHICAATSPVSVAQPLPRPARSRDSRRCCLGASRSIQPDA
jgi:hypothetical protein